MELKKVIRNIPDFPKDGIIFRDITPLIQDPVAFSDAIELFHDRYHKKHIDIIAGIESRGFIFGAALAHRLGVGFIPIRKKNKLPWKTISQEYELEYGTDALEMHMDAVTHGQKVLLVDDLIATGGSLSAAGMLIQRLEGEIIEAAVVIELVDLKGRENIAPIKLFSLIKFEGK